MFTGIVQTKLVLESVTQTAAGVRLTLATNGWSPQGLTFSLGDSISVSGVCLTLASLSDRSLGFDVIPQTLRMTNLGGLVPGCKVNVEPAMTAASQFGGHIVQGHVDGVGLVLSNGLCGQEWRIRVKPPTELMDYMVPKGAITLDGVSLTLADLGPDWIEVALIPTTLEITTLGTTKAGDTVNIEADVFAKTVVHFMRRAQLGSPKVTA